MLTTNPVGCIHELLQSASNLPLHSRLLITSVETFSRSLVMRAQQKYLSAMCNGQICDFSRRGAQTVLWSCTPCRCCRPSVRWSSKVTGCPSTALLPWWTRSPPCTGVKTVSWWPLTQRWVSSWRIVCCMTAPSSPGVLTRAKRHACSVFPLCPRMMLSFSQNSNKGWMSE